MTLNTPNHERMIDSKKERADEATDMLSMIKSMSENDDEIIQEEMDIEDEENMYWSDDEWEVIKAYFENEEDDEDERNLLHMCTQN
ncbi:hypothetical protein G6F56_009824 [Rhizopus delemar]|nr:hypothetical protein G6F56_009824 [Rhizopus delemar]